MPARAPRSPDLLKNQFPVLVAASDPAAQPGDTVLGFEDREERRIREFAVDQSIETIRNRIDQFGVREPVIQRSGADGILVQLPGIQDPQRAKDLIGKTAVLEFKLVAGGADSHQTLGRHRGAPGEERDPVSGQMNSKVTVYPRAQDLDDRRGHRRRARASVDADGRPLRRA